MCYGYYYTMTCILCICIQYYTYPISIYIFIIKYYIECAEPSVCVVYTLQLLPLRLPTVNSRLPSNINIISIAPGAHKDASRIMRNDIIQVYYRPLNFCIPSGLKSGEISLWWTP